MKHHTNSIVSSSFSIFTISPMMNAFSPKELSLSRISFDDENHPNPIVEGSEHCVLGNIPFLSQKRKDGRNLPSSDAAK